MYSNPRSRLTGIGNVVYRTPGYPVYRAYHGPPGLSGWFSHFVKSVKNVVTHPVQTIKKTVSGAEQLVTNPLAYVKSETKKLGPVGSIIVAPLALPLVAAAIPASLTITGVKKGVTSKNPLVKGLTYAGLAAATGAAGFGLLAPLIPTVTGMVAPAPAAPGPVPSVAPAVTTDVSSGAPSQLPSAYGDTGANTDAYNALLAQNNALQAQAQSAASYGGDGGGGGSSGVQDYSSPAGPPAPVTPAPGLLSNPWVLTAGVAALILVAMMYSKKKGVV